MVLDFIEILKVIFLGIVEGITEWLPISSTGHMILVDEFITLNMSEAFKEMFFVVIQLGAILAVVVMFWNKMFPFQFKNKAQSIVKKDTGSVKNFVALVKNGSFLVRITDMTILIEKEFIYGSSKRPNPTDYYRKQHYQCG